MLKLPPSIMSYTGDEKTDAIIEKRIAYGTSLDGIMYDETIIQMLSLVEQQKDRDKWIKKMRHAVQTAEYGCLYVLMGTLFNFIAEISCDEETNLQTASQKEMIILEEKAKAKVELPDADLESTEFKKLWHAKALNRFQRISVSDEETKIWLTPILD